MLKGRLRILFKSTECSLFNLRYFAMACIGVYICNICISVSDPCKPRWKLRVRDLSLIRKPIKHSEGTAESNLNRMKIFNSVWIDHYSKLPEGTVERHLKIHILIL